MIDWIEPIAKYIATTTTAAHVMKDIMFTAYKLLVF